MLVFFARIFDNSLVDPGNLASCFKLTVPQGIQVSEQDVPASDHTDFYFKITNCNESFYQQLLAHSERVGAKEEQRTRAVEDFVNYHLAVPPAGPEACEANFVDVASFGAAMLYSPRDNEAVVFIDTY